MTVISKSQNKYDFPTSVNNSDTESLHLGSASASDVESLHNEPLPIRRILKHKGLLPKFDDNITYPKHSGRRKLRRYQNRTTLQSLSEEDENVPCIFEQVKSPLSKLFENPVSWECWNRFMEKSEDEQRQIIVPNKEVQKSEIHENIKVDNLFLRISSKIRRTLKIRRNLSAETVKSFEDEIVSFFNNSPQDKYEKYPLSSFDRLLTHAVAQFHRLFSASVWENEKRKVEIRNFMDNWTPAEHYLYEWIIKKKS